MTDNNDMVTLNIYNNPPPQLADETAAQINQTDQDYNLNTEKPRQKPTFYDNVRNGQQNYNSAPRNYNNRRNMESSVDESSESTENNNNTPIRAVPPQNMQYQNNYYQQVPVRPVQLGAPMAPMAYQYNMAYAQPVIIQGKQPSNTNQPIRNAPQTIIIKEERKTKDHSGEDCCAGCLAACAACLTCCCLMALCSPGPHGPRRGRW